MEKTLWEIYNDTQLAELETLTADYKNFLDAGKTERECVTEVIRLAEKEGYVDLNQKDTLQAGDKVYLDWMGKSIVLFQIGEDPLENGMNILGAMWILRVWISNRIRCMRKVDLHILIHTTMAESKNISG